MNQHHHRHQQPPEQQHKQTPAGALRCRALSSPDDEPPKARRPADRIRRARQVDLIGAVPYQAREPCPRCNVADAYLLTRAGQATVRCATCLVHLYNAPKTETGETPRTVRTLRRGIRPGQQARIFNRDQGRCILCGSRDELTIGHLLSIEDGARLGAEQHILYSDANLAAMCEACNLGLRHGPRSISPRTYAVIMWMLSQAEDT